MRILFVCTGNTCRSPMAQAMASALLGDKFSVISAGLMAQESAAASSHAIAAMHERQLDLKAHRSQPVTETLLAEADLILTMTSSHKAALLQAAPGKLFTISEYAGGDLGKNVSDPFGGSLDLYRECAKEIHCLLLMISNKLLKEDILENLHVTTHPLVESKLTMLRDTNTGNKEFRELTREIATFMCYEATRDVPLTDVDIETPVGKMRARHTESKFAIIPILRAGLGMVDGVSALLPTAKIGHIGIYRDPETKKPVEYYCKLPPDCAEREVLLLEPIIGTGGTTVAAVDYLKESGVKKIKLLSLVAAPEGVKFLLDAHPDVCIYTAALDECLNDQKYVVPGLGDAGDRLFGTK